MIDENIIKKAVGSDVSDFSVEIPGDKNHGDYSTNVAMVLKKNPNEKKSKVISSEASYKNSLSSCS